MNQKKSRVIIGAAVGGVALVAIALCLWAPQYLDHFAVLVAGVLLCCLQIGGIVKTYRCKKKVRALLESYGFRLEKKFGLEGAVHSCPVFTYYYQGKEYTEEAAEVFSQRYALKHYQEGEIYEIYLDENEPTFIKCKRRIGVFEVFMLFVGVILVAFPIVLLFL